ncbi:hypothetical protein QQZ08_003818 [Neonectria magnoliae]|uniref:Bacteriophage T5 Orf172 DNA-binding domain-containing protein n=1 Tax=Neonectria magnoliae TaxID=2732573 RepID=A0ABR1I7P3_9HYPO
MSLPASLLVWPATSSTLRELLGLDSKPRLRCIGQTKKDTHCEIKGSGQASTLVSSLLGQIVSSESLVAARSLLVQVSHLVLCRHHKKDRLSYLESWEKQLGSLKAAAVKAEDKDDESTLAELSVKVTRFSPRRRRSSDQKDKAKEETPERKTSRDIKPRAIVASPSKPIPHKSPKPTPSKKITHKFEPFGDPLSIETRNKSVKKLVLRSLSRSLSDKERSSEGCIYVYTFPENYHDAAPYLKIGNASDLDNRMASWERQCGYKPKVLYDFRTELYVKVERLVHAQLRNQRIRETGGCPRCQVKHQEWFRVQSSKACEVVGLWTAWTRQEPYHESGILKDKWLVRLEGLDMSDPDCWEKFVNGKHEDDEDDCEDEDIESGLSESEADNSDCSSEYEYDSSSSDDCDYV